MAQDIRKMLQEETPETNKLSEGHEARFEARLAEAVSDKKDKPSFFWMKIAAVGILLLSLGYFGFQQLSGDNDLESELADTVIDKQDNADQFTLGDISPDLKKVEDFYLAGINVQLASLEVNDDNRELMEGYLQRINELDEEYALLNTELNKNGPSEASVNALIDNLKLRLELLFKLKNKLKELKNIDNEEFNSIQS